MKALLATLSLAALSTTAMAGPTQFSVPSGQLTRAEVRASIDAQTHMVDHGEAINFTIPQGENTRAEVRAEFQADRADRSYGDASSMRSAAERRLYVGG